MTWLKWKNHNIIDVEMNLLLSALQQRYGYDFTGYARASLKRRLLELTRYYQLEKLSGLLSALLYDEAVAQTVINSISVPTSEFFRDGHVWREIRDTVLPQLDSFPWINIWQVGCGRGEETYTLAILLHESGLLKKTRIFTSDINPAFLQDARQGRWSRRRLEAWRKNYQNSGGVGDFDRYFEVQGDEIFIHDEFKSTIEFIQHNLVEDDVFKEVQFMVCRNVLIYFGESLQEQVLNMLTRSLERGGYLLLGQAEKIFDLHEKHHELFELSGSLYRKTISGCHHV
ncbi:MAG: protein-glutamate O-methyltransferase CheR [Gallionella sp.]